MKAICCLCNYTIKSNEWAYGIFEPRDERLLQCHFDKDIFPAYRLEMAHRRCLEEEEEELIHFIREMF